ncbi:MAG: transglycosylase SLT domain-containing protein [Blastocatellia bacterium]
MTKYFLIIVLFIVFSFPLFAQQSDAALRRVREQDIISRDPSGKLQTLPAAEHLSRAEVYSSNRLFPEAREHWSKVFENYPNEAGMPKALFGTARSFMWERKYDKAVEWFQRLAKDHLNTKDGREGLAFLGASYVRLGKNLEAVKAYEQYTAMFPQGERIESAHLNIIDALREAKKYDEANKWVDKTVRLFAGKPSEVNAFHAKLRMEIYRENWNVAVQTADAMLNGKSFAGTMASSDEVKFLRAFALEKAGKKLEAYDGYASISRSYTSYFGDLADSIEQSDWEMDNTQSMTKLFNEHPVIFRTELLRESRKHSIDPRFLLAIMKQESSFRANAKSPAGARGLLQLVFDTALKYNKKAGYPNLQPDDLYSPSVNIAIGSVYVAELRNEFGGLYEAIAASYNGGEDNAARWLNRSKPKEPGIFVSEIGFAETKNYLFKVMNNYRVYSFLYDENLVKK